MSRTAVYSALVLRSRSSGETNNEVFLLTAEEGVIRATVFGGPKSKLRSHSAPYNSGQVWIYRDPAKDYRKLSDFDVHSWRPGLRELYDRSMAAGALAETILSSHGGGGDWVSALNLAVASLDTLENANEELCEHLLVHFLWRWAGFLGIQPQAECCTACEKEAPDNPFWFSTRENTMLCADCAPSVPGLLQLNPGSRRWLAAVGEVEPSFLHRFSMDNRSFNEAKALATAIMTGVLGKRLSSWEW
jgi:DNA repair protein RecO (recombination protein O)